MQGELSLIRGFYSRWQGFLGKMLIIFETCKSFFAFLFATMNLTVEFSKQMGE